MVQLQHLGEKRLGGLGGGVGNREDRRAKRKVSSLVQFVHAKVLWSILCITQHTHTHTHKQTSPWWCWEKDEMRIHKQHKKWIIHLGVFQLCKTDKQLNWNLKLMERHSSGAQQGHCYVFLFNLLFSHTYLVPTIGPNSKGLVAAPITALCSLQDKTIEPLVCRHNRPASPAGYESSWTQRTRESSSLGLRMLSSHSWLTYGSTSHSPPSPHAGHGVSQSAGVTCDSSDRNWPITLPVGGLQQPAGPLLATLLNLFKSDVRCHNE